MNRRNFLAAMGLASGSLFLPSLGRRAHSAPGDPPMRLIVVFHQHGGWMPTWRINPANNPDDAMWTQDLSGLALNEFSESLAPLHAHRNRLTVLEGVSLVSGDADPAGVLRHEIGQVQALTGGMVEMVAGLPMSTAPSIDQVVANQIARPDRLRSIEIGVGDPPMSVNYRDRLQLLPFEGRAPVVFERLFGLVNGGSGAGAVLSEQGSVLDKVKANYDVLSARLGAEDRAKLDIHRDLVRDLESQVSGLLGTTCSGVPQQPMQSEDYTTTFTSMAQMLVSAMSCDLLRVATLHLGDVRAEDIGYPGENVHDGHAHNVFIQEISQQVMTDYYAYHSAQVAELLDLLDAIPEGDGTMLDNTLVLWMSELADGSHGFDQVPVVMAGGQQWTNGRFIHYPRDTPATAITWDGNKLPVHGRPHQELLNSVARAFEVPDPDTGGQWAAPVRELHGNDGSTIDCSGVLEGLFQ